MQEDFTGFLRLVQEEGAACIWDADDHGWTALHWACARGSTALTFAILREIQSSQAAGFTYDREGTEASSDRLNLPEKLNGWGPLHLAVIGSHLEVIYLLMEAGCDPFAEDKAGDRPIDCIKRTKKQSGLVKRMRNALLDLTDTEESSGDESIAPSPPQGNRGNNGRLTAPSRPPRRKGPSRERNRHR
ncbi:unnamed protein product [Hapterophycus canaliculatus]